MSFDKPTRDRLKKFVADARSVIADEFTEQFQSLYGISAKGDIAPLEKLGHLDEAGLATAALLRERIEYLEKTHPDDKDGTKAAVSRLAREQAFTILNRFAAIRMAEKRGLIVESIAKGYQSAGFRTFATVAGSAFGETYDSYRRYIFCLFDELAIDLGVLFDRRSPQALLFPRKTKLEELLEILNAPDLERLWAEDETIGWIYQYYNDPEERKKMRKDSAAPRNSRELAVRNQFFTPRYVVEFLTDNTLGRIWYEMTKGETRLAEQCRYLVRRPTEIFLADGEATPETPDQEGLSQEELLRQPVHIPHRPLKDPREIRLLDPACGSMHFGLYAFDLFETIYEEAWDMVERMKDEGRSMKELETAFPDFSSFIIHTPSFSSKEEFLLQVPRLIIEHNIHGIDIDPRATQIAALSLWLRAQKAWQQQNVPAADRPRVRRSNIVCAEPMPGSPEMLEEFIVTLNPPLLGELVKSVFDKMQLAGEAGSLLKIEEEIRTAIDTARKEWLKQQDDLLTRKDGSQEEFFNTAEQQVIDALRAYAEQADADSYQRRLFADDAARGFAFIDLCRKHYDAVVMNPPFGDCSPSIKTYLKKTYKDNSVELYCAFVDRDLSLMHPGGLIGCITSSSFVLYTDFSGYREFLLQDRCLEYLANLGDSVLDGAYVYTACYIVRNSPPPSLIGFCDLRFEQEKDNILVQSTQQDELGSWRMLPPHKFVSLASSPLCHWASDALFSLAENSPSFGSVLEDAGVGAAPQADFFDLWWEVPPSHVGKGRRWVRIANGGAFSPYHRGDNLVVDWEGNGKRAIADLNHRYPYLNGNVGIRIQRTHLFGRPGITYGKRSDRFNAQFLPAEMIFTFEGIGVFPKNEDPNYILGLLAFLNSRFVAYYLNLTGGLHKNDVYIRRLPFPLSEDDVLRLGDRVKMLIPLVMNALAVQETHPHFSGSFLGREEQESVGDLAANFKMYDRINEELYFTLLSEIECAVSDCCGLDTETLREVTIDQGFDIQRFGSLSTDDAAEVLTPERERPGFCRAEFEQSSDLFRLCIDERIPPSIAAPKLNEEKAAEDTTVCWFAGALLSFAVGTCFGRWDIRYATSERQSPELPDPFEPLPVCPPGMLQNADGLPMAKDEGRRIKDEGKYPLRVSWDGILVDDENHPEDLIARVREAVELIWKDRAEAIEQEACDILGVKSLRDYFRRPAAFFADHLKRYSKSRRQAPIYWPLSTKSGSYTLWLYYHRLTDQTLHTCLADFLDPKIRKVQSELDALTGSGGGGTRASDLREFLDELRDLHDEIERVIKLPWKPNLNDGVLITASPLHKLFRLPKWQKDLKACWDKLSKGEYDWAHLAYAIRPREVEKACEKDRSIAIAHGLEHLCKVQPPKAKKRGKKAVENDEDETEENEED